MNIKDLPFAQQMQIHESNIRGTYLSISCDYERLMDDLIVMCEKDIAMNIKNYKNIKIRGLSMGKKVGRCKDGLKKYNSSYSKDFAPHFICINELLKYRNILAHGYSEYDPDNMDTSYIKFDYVINGKRYAKTIEVKPFLMQLDKYRESIMKMVSLSIKIRYELGLLH